MWPRPAELTVRTVLAFALLMWLTHRYGQNMAEAIVPLFKSMLGWLDPRFQITDFSVGFIGGDRQPSPDLLFRLEVTLLRPIAFAQGVLMPQSGGWLAASSTVGNFLQPIVLAMGLILAWPVRTWQEAALRVALGLSLIAPLLLLDMPLMLWAYIWERPHQHYDPNGFSMLQAWSHFLTRGGRPLLGLVAGTAAIVLTHLVLKRCSQARPDKATLLKKKIGHPA